MVAIQRLLACALAMAAVAMPVRADELGRYNIADVMAQPGAKERLDRNIRLYFAYQGTPVIAQNLGEARYTRRTNRGSTAAKGPCPWAFLGGLLALQGKARERGGNAVVNIVALHDGKQTAPPGQYDCEFGLWMVSIEVQGDIVKLEGQ